MLMCCCLVFLAEAEPSEKEKDVHSRVADILVRAPDILTNIQNYNGAGEKIREVRSCYMDEGCCHRSWLSVHSTQPLMHACINPSSFFFSSITCSILVPCCLLFHFSSHLSLPPPAIIISLLYGFNCLLNVHKKYTLNDL